MERADQLSFSPEEYASNIRAAVELGLRVGRQRGLREGANITANTLQHLVNGRLALACGYTDLVSAGAMTPEEGMPTIVEGIDGATRAITQTREFIDSGDLTKTIEMGQGPMWPIKNGASYDPTSEHNEPA